MESVKNNREAATAGRAAPFGESGSGLPAYAPGVAWEEAKKALAAGNLEEADRLRRYMEKSDSGLMLARIIVERQRLEDAANAKGRNVK